ncbi:MmgE/PrpD family protein [Sinomonas cellulolyticus]|uniref:MmgE/PrpD family protein n=1 Tax=Sinomonas cellulolyticus TaxID=2801916 RepID=A0ABS1K8G4_9MICC|nr:MULTISPECIES: MmgE/PrpD family protein [Sinomonas]MBL0707187.1 MmgE/PrpD family protein [Sinomonas cellulolyticus]
MTQLRDLAEWAATLTIDDIPDEVLTQAAWCVLDLLGVTVAASRDDAVTRLIAAERTMDDSRQARVLVRGDRFSVPAAARINAFTSSLTELADNVSVHANEANIPLALAYGEHHGVNGADVLVAVVVGAETARRLHDVYYDAKRPASEFPVGMTSPLNTFGSAFTAARLMGADPQTMLDTANVSFNLIASALDVTVMRGSELKPMLFSGWPSACGYTAATYAAHGLTAAPDSFFSPQGGWLPGAAEVWNADEFTRDLGTRWELQRPDRKRHAACGFSHSALDSVLDLTRDVTDMDRIERIDVGLFPFGAQTVGGPADGITTSTAAKFNLRYLIASALRCGSVVAIGDTAEGTIPGRLADPEFVKVMDKVTVTANEEYGFARRFTSDVRVRLAGGEERTAVLDHARGRGDNQLTKTELDEKYTTLAAPVLGDERAEQVRRVVDELVGVDDVTTLVDLLVD